MLAANQESNTVVAFRIDAESGRLAAGSDPAPVLDTALTRLTTPFLAAGGSSLLANWIIVGLLLMISHTARGPVDTTPLPPGKGSEAPGIDTPTEAVKHL